MIEEGPSDGQIQLQAADGHENPRIQHFLTAAQQTGSHLQKMLNIAVAEKAAAAAHSCLYYVIFILPNKSDLILEQNNYSLVSFLAVNLYII